MSELTHSFENSEQVRMYGVRQFEWIVCKCDAHITKRLPQPLLPELIEPPRVLGSLSLTHSRWMGMRDLAICHAIGDNSDGPIIRLVCVHKSIDHLGCHVCYNCNKYSGTTTLQFYRIK